MPSTDPPVRRLVNRLAFLSKCATGMGVWPDFVIIGGTKCATSAFYENLVQHPHVHKARRKEVHYFDTKFQQGTWWYRANFPSRPARWWTHGLRGQPWQTGEATPYYLFHPHAPRRLREKLPDAKLVALLREPVARAYSHYQHMLRDGRETLSFEDAIAQEAERLEGEREKMLADESYRAPRFRIFSYKARGLYVDQLEAWAKHFPRERLLVLQTEAYQREPQKVMARTLEFLGLEKWDGFVHEQHNVGGYKESIGEKVRDELRAYFKPHNERLWKWLGEEWDWDAK